jgi:hypothetical protein
MSLNENTVIELIHLATTSDELDLLNKLSNSININVRRAVAKNKNIDSSIANKLLFDPVLNVSYQALFNPNVTINRNFDERELTPCVKCTEDERTLNCKGCAYFKV